jgi:Secretion system C-terminal sorting domain
MIKKYLFTLLLMLYALMAFAQTYQLTINNGYGAGQYAVGDTVHIWAKEWDSSNTFRRWAGQTSSLADIRKWHTTLVMPAQNVAITAMVDGLPAGADFTETQIQGRDTLKRLFYYLPPGGPPKQVIWLFHGTGGNAGAFVYNFENRQFSNRLMADSLAIITMESEETTKNIDLDGSGTIRWNYTLDSVNNVDIANMRAIRDTFIQRGWILPSTPHAAAGFSAGGAFSEMVAMLLQWRASVNHNTGGPDICAEISPTPNLKSNSWRDGHPEVGQQGNLDAYTNYEKYQARGICSEFFMLYPTPLHPERFRKLLSISLATSEALFQELQANNCLNAKSYLTKSANDITAEIVANPLAWPVLLSLSNVQRDFVKGQIEYLWTAHSFTTEFMYYEIRFLKNPCNTVGSIGKSIDNELFVSLYPSPASSFVAIPNTIERVRLFDLSGQLMMDKYTNGQNQLDISGLANGLYFVEMYAKGVRGVSKLVKM